MSEPTRAATPRLGIGVTLAVLGAAGFATSGPMSKAVLGAGLTPLQLSQARQTVTALALLAVVAMFRPAVLRIRLKQLPMLVVYGTVSYLLLQTCYYFAISRIPVGVALLIQFTAPVLIALWVRFMRGVALPGVTWIGGALVLAGAVFVGEVWSGFQLDPIGVAAACGTALCLVGFYLMAERGLADFDPIGLVVWGSTSASVLFAIVQPLWYYPFGLLAGTGSMNGSTWPLWLLVLGIGVVSTAIPAVCEVAAMRYIASPTASVIGTAEVVLGATFAWLMIGEVLTGPQLLGGVIMVLGIALAQLRPLPQTGLAAPQERIRGRAGANAKEPQAVPDLVAAAPVPEPVR
jgi:drug/metabolite transporter (DMT)-like permease